MDILQVNKFHYIKGGAERYYFELSELLEEKGHSVIFFSMQDARNRPAPLSEFFTSNVDYDAVSSAVTKLVAAGRIIYSFEAKKKMDRLLAIRRPDIAHLHNIYHQLSPSILHALERAGVPSVMTAHDYKLVCPNYLLYADDKVCERCAEGRFYNALFSRCLRGSLLTGIVLTAEMYLHRLLGSYDILERIIAPSEFLRKKLLDAGFAADRVVHIPNFIARIPESAAERVGDYVAYAGRLSREKGLGTLVRAMSGLPSITLKIAGDGPEKPHLTALCASLGARNVEFVGHLGMAEVENFIASSAFMAVPSEYFENCPLSILESMSLGKPVVGASIGGIPELVEDGDDGFLFRPGDAEHLRDRIDRLYGDRHLTVEMGRRARRKVTSCYTRDIHYERIMAVYRDVRTGSGG
jgi:glycosyltransferase involved in cell wall biosynthesis